MLVALTFALTLAPCARAATIYVDLFIVPANCADYSPAARACGGGTDIAYRTLQGAATVAVAGDTVEIRGGAYPEALVPAASGLPGSPITYRSYVGETAFIGGVPLDPAIDLSGRSWIVLEGLTVAGVVGWLRAQDSHWNVVRACWFTRATALGSRAGLKFIDATYNRIEGNRIEDGNDNVLLIASDRNVIAGNYITRARHALWSILCGSFNVVRENVFHNAIQKSGQVTDCEGVPSDTPILYDATKRNLIEWNVTAYTASSGNASPYAGIQHAAQDSIIRRNTFYDTVGPALDLTLYADEARFNTGNRVYHDVFLGTDLAGVSISGGTGTFSDNIFKNNVVARSVFVANDTRWPWYVNDLAGRPVQVLTGRLDGFVFERNNIIGAVPGELGAVTNGVRTSGSNPPLESLAWWEANQPALFRSNLEVDPGFVNDSGLNVHLVAGSALIDAGAFLTRAIGAGTSTSLPVADASWFFDGFEIPGEQGDFVQLEGQALAVRVLDIDYATNTLVLESAVTWTDGQGVTQAFEGSAPDVGVYEWESPADLLRNASSASRAFSGHRAILSAGRDPVLDPVRDLRLADIRRFPEIRVAGDALPVGDGNPGVLIFYEVTNAAGPIIARKDVDDVFLSGW